MNWITNLNYGDKEFIIWIEELLDYISQGEVEPHTWIDIGGHRGKVTESLVKYSDYRDQIFVFEPNQHRYKKLCKKFKNHPNVMLWPVAVNNNMSMSAFFVPWIKLFDAGSFLNFSPVGITKRFCTGIPTLTIPLTQLNWNNVPRITFIKIDAEGNDFLIIQQSKDLINEHRPIILFEFSGLLSGNSHGYTKETWYDFFKNNNYHLRVPYGGHHDAYILERYEKYSPELYNLLAVPNESPLPF